MIRKTPSISPYKTFLPLAILPCMSTEVTAQILIDNFRSSPSVFVANNPGDPAVNQTMFELGIIGGTRELTFNSFAPTPSGSLRSLFLFADSLGGETYRPGEYGLLSNDTGLQSEFTLSYNGNGAGLNADFSGLSEILLEWGSDDIDVGESLTLFMSDNDSGFQVSIPLMPINSQGARETQWDLQTFASNGIDLDSIQEIRLTGITGDSDDNTYSSLRAVPEPSTLFFHLGGLLLIFARRRRNE